MNSFPQTSIIKWVFMCNIEKKIFFILSHVRYRLMDENKKIHAGEFLYSGHKNDENTARMNMG